MVRLSNHILWVRREFEGDIALLAVLQLVRAHADHLDILTHGSRMNDALKTTRNSSGVLNYLDLGIEPHRRSRFVCRVTKYHARPNLECLEKLKRLEEKVFN